MADELPLLLATLIPPPSPELLWFPYIKNRSNTTEEPIPSPAM